jgi:hypothetical protein
MLRTSLFVICALSSAAAMSDTYPRTTGGFYQVTDNNSGNINNPATGGLTCGQGFFSVAIGRVKHPEIRWGAMQYACLSDETSEIPGYAFGGMYQIDDSGRKHVPNAINSNNLSCPDGFDTILKGRVQAPETGWGATQYVCLSQRVEAPRYRLRGLYQVNDNGQGNIPNHYTNSTTCAAGELTIAVGRVKSPETKWGGTQYACVQAL